jgi:hypothetical protein
MPEQSGRQCGVYRGARGRRHGDRDRLKPWRENCIGWQCLKEGAGFPVENTSNRRKRSRPADFVARCGGFATAGEYY